MSLIGDKLAGWVDHHKNVRWPEYSADPRYRLAEADSCPRLINLGEFANVELLLAHGDMDGILSAAKALGYTYPELEADADAADTRRGVLSRFAQMCNDALRADMADDETRYQIVAVIAGLLPESVLRQKAERYAEVQARTMGLAKGYEVRGAVAYVDATGAEGPYDLTALLLSGEKMARVAAAKTVNPKTGRAGITMATLDKGLNLVEIFGLQGGAPSRVNLPAERLGEIFERFAG
jgi:hypothetical protein